MSIGQRPPALPAVAAVVLAAGTSSRWGSDTPKQLARWHGEPLVRRAVDTALASAAVEVVVVTGYRAETVEAALAGRAVRLERNPEFASGQASSIRVGIGALREDVEGALFVPCDQPRLDHATLDLLIESFAELGPGRRSRALIPVHAARRGSPALIGAELFPRLSALRGDQGGRAVLAAIPERVVEVEVGSNAPLVDVDTPAELEALQSSERAAE